MCQRNAVDFAISTVQDCSYDIGLLRSAVLRLLGAAVEPDQVAAGHEISGQSCASGAPDARFVSCTGSADA